MQPQARVSSYINPDKRADFREFKQGKNIAHMTSNNIIAHTAQDPQPVRMSDAKLRAKGLTTSFNNPKAIDRDTF